VRRGPIAILLCAVLVAAGCGGDDDSPTGSTESAETTAASEAPAKSEPAARKTKPKITVPKGAPPQELETKDLEEGSGAEAKSGDQVTVHYVGVTYKNGKEFDASWDRGEAYPFPLGAGEVIAGWDQGIVGMKVGGRRELIIPPELAYGEEGRPPAIPPNETLVFVVDLLAVE
jgi:peptidylprolyl isomerase